MQPLIRAATANDAAPAKFCVVSAFHQYIERIGKEPAPMLLDFSAQVEARHVWVAESDTAVVGVLVQYETELGFYIDSDGSGKPYRCRTRPPSFIHFATFPQLMEGHQISDVPAILGSLNIIAAELDR